MQKMGSDWYRKIWTLAVQDQSWVEDTERQVDFLVKTLNLRGGETILDLACGFGRHSLVLARRGFDVTGVDNTPEYVRYANETARKEGLNARFFCCDIREVSYNQQFDVVLNMADGAVGYLENDVENEKIFRVVCRALKPGGKHFMDIMNGGYADTHFPCKQWDAGEKGLTPLSSNGTAEPEPCSTVSRTIPTVLCLRNPISLREIPFACTNSKKSGISTNGWVCAL